MQYTRIAHERDLLEGLAEDGAHILCGGTDLLVKLRSGMISPSLLLDVSDFEDLRGMVTQPEALFIGAATPLSDVLAHDTVRAEFPLLASALEVLGSVQIRNRGSIGGNLVNASPAADSAIPLLLYDAEIHLVGTNASRWLELGSFLVAPGKTLLDKGEYVREIRIPRAEHPGTPFFHKIGKRRALTISIASIGTLARFEDGHLLEFRVAAGSVAPVPMRLPRVEQLLASRALTPELIEQARCVAAESVSPIDDVRASAAYRRAVVGDLVARSLERLLPGHA